MTQLQGQLNITPSRIQENTRELSKNVSERRAQRPPVITVRLLADPSADTEQSAANILKRDRQASARGSVSVASEECRKRRCSLSTNTSSEEDYLRHRRYCDIKLKELSIYTVKNL